jgi:hypothetical protein
MASVASLHGQPTCPVCGVIVDEVDIVVFDHGDLIHIECSDVRQWPPLDGIRISAARRRAASSYPGM